jgi:pyrroline-5-carboxylate reductase
MAASTYACVATPPLPVGAFASTCCTCIVSLSSVVSTVAGSRLRFCRSEVLCFRSTVRVMTTIAPDAGAVPKVMVPLAFPAPLTV